MNKILHILHLEDDPRDAELLRLKLEEANIECVITVVQTRDEFVNALKQGNVDLIVSDFSLPSFDGNSALEIASQEWSDIPFIFVSGTMGEEAAIESMVRGATDYVLKGKLSRLVPAMQRALLEAENHRESKRAEKQIALLAHTLKSVAECVSITDMNDIVLFVNDAFLKTYGYTEDEILGKNVNAVRSPNNPPEITRGILAATLAGGWSGELLNRRKDGRDFPVSLSTSFVRDEHGEVVALVGVATDITERKHVEQLLRESEERLRVTLESTNISTWDWDLRNDVWQTSPTFYTMLGNEPDPNPQTREDSLQSFHPDDRAAINEKIREVLNGTNSEYQYEARVKHADGSYRWHSVIGHTIERDEHGKSTRLTGVRMDITERKRAKEALEKSEEHYRQFFEDDLTGDYVSTPEGKILACNPAFAHIFGFASVEEALNSDMYSLYAEPEDREIFLRLLKERRKLEYYESVFLCRDGTHVYCVSNAVGIFDQRENLVQIRGYIFDDTKRKTLERQLVQAQKLESLGTLASGIAHDFNNILGIIMGYASLLSRGEPDQKTIRINVDAVLKASLRGAALVRQLLTFARKSEVQLAPVRFNDIVNEISELLSETIEKTIEIALDLDKKLPAILADATQIHQVILNLCVNARDAMPNGGKLTITTSRQQGDSVRTKFPMAAVQEYVMLTVADTGTGMDKVTRTHIFEPFFSTKEVGKGTGLGLSVVFGIMESHKGFVSVESEPGRGTTFYLYFPMLESMELEQVIARVQKEIPGGTETILVVEDEEALRELLRTSLQSAGYTVLTAVDGQEAIDLFDQHGSDIQLVLSDIGLPKLSGYDVYRKMKRTKPNLRFILASGFMDPMLKYKIFKEGVKSFIQKPYSVYEVLQAVRTILDRK